MVGRTNAMAGGKQWKFATGQISDTYASTAKTFTVSGLEFKPRIVVASFGSGANPGGEMSVGMLDDNDSVVFAGYASTSEAKYGSGSGSGHSGFTPNDSGFSMNAIPKGIFYWRAWGY